MLEIANVEVKYVGVILVLKGVSLEVADGSVVALLGANGSGKTTTLRAISGLLKTQVGEVTDGTITFDGKRIENGDPEDAVALGISQVMEGRRMLVHLTVEENLRAGAIGIRGRGLDIKRDVDRIYGYFPKLRGLRNQMSGYISGGEQQMVSMGRAMMSHPRLMLLDEPSLGLAPMVMEEIFRIIAMLNTEEKTSMLLVEQNAQNALEVADHGYVMEGGRIVLDGPAEKLKENEDIKEFYLGLSQVGAKKSYREVKHYRRRKRWLG